MDERDRLGAGFLARSPPDPTARAVTDRAADSAAATMERLDREGWD